jgi:hypothetical protein
MADPLPKIGYSLSKMRGSDTVRPNAWLLLVGRASGPANLASPANFAEVLVGPLKLIYPIMSFAEQRT